MKTTLLPWIPLFVLGATLLPAPVRAVHADEEKKPAAAAPSTSAGDADLEHALAEFKASAERLGKSMTQVAADGTTEARSKVMKTMNKAILGLSQSMDRAAKKIGGSHKNEKD